MITIEHKAIDNTIEHQITTAMIISTRFASEVNAVFNPEYMRSAFCRIICVWCTDYFNKYKEAPGLHIKDIYMVEKDSGMTKADSELIGDFLNKLSDQYSEGRGVNADYIRDGAFEYFRKRELELCVEKTQKFLLVDKVEEAGKALTNYKKIAYQTSGWFNPFDHKEILEVFVDNDEGVFRYPGALGRVVGPIERDWFVAFLAPFKKGKTWAMQETGVYAMFQGLRVVFISLEMKKKNLKERFYKRLTALGSRTGEDVFLIPVFDCEHNQKETCTNPKRTNKEVLVDSDGILPPYTIDNPYRACTYCRDNMITDYRMVTWYETIEVPQFTLKRVRQHLDGTKIQYGDMIRFISYPRFLAGIDDIHRDVQILEQHEGFIPDIIIIDYADILKMGKGDKRNEIDDVWKKLASMAAERHCIVFTASQGTRGSIYKNDMNQDDLAEWIGKLGHVDIFMGLNQSPKEKENKIIRVNVLVHRHKEADEKVSATLLQQLELGQFAMDSEITRRTE